MNETQKAIAKIIKNKLVGNDLPDTAKEVAEDIAKVFEKEDKICSRCSKPMEKTKKYGEEQYICTTFETPLVKKIRFIKKQFFKNAGVK